MGEDLYSKRGIKMNPVINFFKKLSSYDHRQAPRRQTPLLVAYYWDGAAPMAHEVRDISSTGFYLLTQERWHLGTIVTITLQRTDNSNFDSGTQPHIAVMSKVVRLDEDGVGFAFIPVETTGPGPTKPAASGPVGKKALGRFLEQLQLDKGTAVAGL
jgi:hypothetical protein